MKKITTIVTFLVVIVVQAQNFTGTWSSTYGELRFIQEGNKVYGDYSNKGMIEGVMNNNVLTGTFTNGSRKGNIKFTLNNDKFSGTWNFINSNQILNWSGSRKNINVPVLTSEAKNFIKPSGYTVLNNPNIYDGITPVNLQIYKFPSVLKMALVNNDPKTKLEIGNNDTNTLTEKSLSKPKEVVMGDKNCTTSNTEYNSATSDFGYFVSNGTPEFLKPGVLMNYQDILSGNYRIINTPRNPLTIYLESIASQINSGDLSAVVDKPENISQINNQLGTLNSKIRTNNIPANMSIEVSEIKSEEQLQYGVTGSYNNKSAGIGVKFGINNNSFKESYFYMVKFVQNMYTIRADHNTFSFKNNNVPNTDKLAYISEVTYGRKGFLLIKTNKSKSELKASLGVDVNIGVHKGNIDTFLNKVSKDESSEVKIFFYGGSSSAAGSSLQSPDFKQGFNKWVEQNAGNGLTALPISYKLKNLNGDQLILRSVFSVSQQTCVPIKTYKLKVEFENIKNYKSNDSDKNDDYAIEFEPVLIIDGKTYELKDKKISTKQNIVSLNPNNLFVYDNKNAANQLHIREGETRNIQNSGVFVIPEGVDLKNADFQIKFRIFESTGKSLDRIVGVSKMGGYNIHKHSLIEIIQVLSNAKSLENDYKDLKCKPNCKGTDFGNYGGSDKTSLTANTVPVKKVGNSIGAGEYMKNDTKTRVAGINYSFTLID